MRPLPLALLLLTSACGSTSPPGNSAAQSDALATRANVADTGTTNATPPVATDSLLTVEAKGLRVTDIPSAKDMPLPFGIAQDALLRAVAFQGQPTNIDTHNECGAGPMTIAQFNGLDLLFQDGKFAGWVVNDVKPNVLTTTAGVGSQGSPATLEELKSFYKTSVEKSTLGQEFQAEGIGGLLDGTGPEAKVTSLWAGLTCFLR
jgi:hypothetical protein